MVNNWVVVAGCVVAIVGVAATLLSCLICCNTELSIMYSSDSSELSSHIESKMLAGSDAAELLNMKLQWKTKGM